MLNLEFNPLNLIVFLIILSVLVAVSAYNYHSASSKQFKVLETGTDISTIKEFEERFSKAITYQTVSFEDKNSIGYIPFLEFHGFLKQSFPQVFKKLTVEHVNNYSLLFHWKGSSPNLKPVIFLAHMDVVPVPETNTDLWTYPPFSGTIRDGYVWGRGTTDNKGNLMGQLEAVEFLINRKFQPQRDIYLAYGHDEEVMGRDGAAKIAELLKERGIEPEFVLDEGGFVTNILVPGAKRPVAMVGIAEKAYLDLTLSLEMEGGHSSIPPEDTAIKALSKAVTRLMDNPFKPYLSAPTKAFIKHLAPHSSFVTRLAFSNLWLFKPLIFKMLGRNPKSKALVQTTMVPTIIRGGEKTNVIPKHASVSINYRLLPGTTTKDVINHTRKAIKNPQIKIEVSEQRTAIGAVARLDNKAFEKISDAIHKNFDDTVVAPFLMVATTDSRHYQTLTTDIYKFSPMIDPTGFHDVDEKLEISVYKQAIGFYVDLIKSI